MNLKQMMKKHYLRLVLEGVIKSTLWGLAVGFGANFLMALLSWIFSFGGIWLSIGVGAGVWLVSGVLLYFFKFKPSIDETAERMDRLGLEERMITMLELKDDKSYIATIQRKNALESIKHVTERKIRLRISRAVICFVVAAAVLGSSMTTVKGLSDSGEIPSFDEIIEDDPYANHIAVTYEADEGGYIDGETNQLVEPGGSTTPVKVVPDEANGWVFAGWDDGLGEIERYETNVTQELYFVALFEKIGEGEGGADGDGEGGKDGGQSAEGDQAEDLPADGGANADSDQNGAQGSEGDGQGSKGDSDGGQGSSDEQGEGKGDGKGQGAGGKWDDSNKFLDGKTYYGSEVDNYYQLALEIFEQTGEIPPELREFFEAYYDSI